MYEIWKLRSAELDSRLTCRHEVHQLPVLDTRSAVQCSCRVISCDAVEGLDGVKVLAPAAPDVPRTGAHVHGAVHGVPRAAVRGEHAVDARVLLER